jgi:nicotinamide mononucleotide transporter
LLTRQTILAWPAGLLSVFLYIFIFYHNRLYSDVILHMVYVVLNVYGWYHWSQASRDGKPLQVTRFSTGQNALLALFIPGAALAWGLFMKKNTGADYAYADAFILVASLTAQYLMTLKKLENWIWWILVDIIAILIYSQKKLVVTSVLYSLYLFLCILGFRAWYRSNKLTTLN